MSLSKFFSIIFHPVFMPIIAVYFTLEIMPEINILIGEKLVVLFIYLAVYTVFFPIATSFLLLKTNYISSLEIKNHKERSAPLLTTLIWVFIGYQKTKDITTNLATPITSQIIGVIIILFFALIISRYWKISLHMLGVGGFMGVFLSCYILFDTGIYMIIISILISVVLAISRIKEKAHNLAQISIGFFLGLLIETATIMFIAKLH